MFSVRYTYYELDGQKWPSFSLKPVQPRALQRPLADELLRIVAKGEREDRSPEFVLSHVGPSRCRMIATSLLMSLAILSSAA
jgi:hypothetical protein